MKLPCKECLTLPICYNIFKESSEADMSVTKLYHKCSLLKTYIEASWGVFDCDESDDPSSLQPIIDFFTDKR